MCHLTGERNDDLRTEVGTWQKGIRPALRRMYTRFVASRCKGRAPARRMVGQARGRSGGGSAHSEVSKERSIGRGQALRARRRRASQRQLAGPKRFGPGALASGQGAGRRNGRRRPGTWPPNVVVQPAGPGGIRGMAGNSKPAPRDFASHRPRPPGASSKWPGTRFRRPADPEPSWPDSRVHVHSSPAGQRGRA